MMRVLAVIVLILLLITGGVQSYRLNSAHGRIDAQQTIIAGQCKKLSQKNSQLIALNILTQTSSQADAALRRRRTQWPAAARPAAKD